MYASIVTWNVVTRGISKISRLSLECAGLRGTKVFGADKVAGKAIQDIYKFDNMAIWEKAVTKACFL
jgi:hypothetical protein